jgi:hypothetical protein
MLGADVRRLEEERPEVASPIADAMRRRLEARS